jgi:hypothetical protein
VSPAPGTNVGCGVGALVGAADVAAPADNAGSRTRRDTSSPRCGFAPGPLPPRCCGRSCGWRGATPAAPVPLPTPLVDDRAGAQLLRAARCRHLEDEEAPHAGRPGAGSGETVLLAAAIAAALQAKRRMPAAGETRRNGSVRFAQKSVASSRPPVVRSDCRSRRPRVLYAEHLALLLAGHTKKKRNCRTHGLYITTQSVIRSRVHYSKA